MMEETLILPADLAQLEHLSAWIDEMCALHSVPDDAHYHLNVALEEVVINAIKHGSCDAREDAIRVTMTLDGDEVRVTISDTGTPFNPLDMPPPDLSGDIAARPIGGLGIHLVRSLMNSVRYERRDGRNWLYLVKRTS
jgi:anti-sigma regulatory factor (Ser/Thr protein kinase)